MGFAQNRDVTENVTEKRAEGPESGRARRLANLKPFRKGASGNPGGRPIEATAELRALAQEGSPTAFARIVDLIESEDPRVSLMACKEILDRAFGKPSRAVVTDDDGSTVQINIIRHTERVPPCS